jgi:hypothetical protein
VLRTFPETQIIITGGDDIEPPDADPSEIQRQFVAHFPALYGVMQPTGDRWMEDDRGKSYSERIAYSPWMGRAWIQEVNQGTGPIWHEYFHFFEDEEMWHVARNQGVYWERPDLSQKHNHWTREGKPRPGYLQGARDDWDKAKALFNRRKATGFPGSERL